MVAGYEARRQLGVLLYDGVSELGLAATIDTYLGSASTRVSVTAPERTIVRSLDGFLFVPRYDFSSAPALDRVLVAAGPNEAAKQQVVTAWSASSSRQPAEDIYQNVGLGESAYDASLQDLAMTRNASLASGVAHALFYPSDSGFSKRRLAGERGAYGYCFQPTRTCRGVWSHAREDFTARSPPDVAGPCRGIATDFGESRRYHATQPTY